MKSWFLYITILFIGLSFSWESFAIDITCPVIKKDTYTPEIIREKIQECLDARNANPPRESSITDFYCPSGDFTLQDGRPLNDNTIPYHVAVAFFFAKIDEDALDYMCKLREMREKDPVKWTEDLRKKTELEVVSGTGSFAARYREVCNFGFVESKINTKEKIWITNTETYPQSICSDIAARKAQTWYNMGTILMGNGIAKAYQNDKDVFVDKVKGKYAKIIDKFIQYSRIANRALKNLTALAKETIQR